MNSTVLLLCALLLPSTSQEPDDLTIAELEARYGPNLLTADPRGYAVPPAARRDTVVHRHYGPQPSLLNGLLYTDANFADSLLAHCLMDVGVRHRDDPNRWAPGIGDYASVSDDQRVVTVRLKRGIRWQFPAVDADDPRHAWLSALFATEPPEVTADDFAFTLQMMQDLDADSPYRGYYERAHIRLLGRYTFQVHWKEFYVYSADMVISFPHLLATFLYARDEDGNALPPADVGAALRDHWHNHRLCGYGPYEFVRMVPNESIVIRRKDDFEPLQPAIQEIHWHVIPSAKAAVQRMIDGQLDFLVFMPDTMRQWVTQGGPTSPFNDGRIATKPYQKYEYLYFGWNCRRAPFDDPRVRRAMSLMLQREAFLRNQFEGFGSLVDSHVATEHPHHRRGLEPIRFDREAASALLDEAGWGDADQDGVRDRSVDGNKVDFTFTLKAFSAEESPEVQSALEVYREDLRSIGVDMRVLHLPWADLKKAMNEFEFDAYTGLWALGWNLDFTNIFHSDAIRGGRNYVGFQHPELDELSVQYVRGGVRDDAARKDIAWRIQDILHEEQPYTFFLRRDRLAAYSPWLQGVEFSLVRPQLLSFPWYQLGDAPR